ncbi:MAG: peptidoglycan recognition family protein [Syntrophomonas sp.]
MNIIETNLKFDGLRPRNRTSLLVLHHSACPDVGAVEIHRWHLQRGWAGIGYHFVIRANGSVERGRPLETIGAHAGPGVNGYSIGICLAGDFMAAAPTDSQIRALLELIVWLKDYYPVHSGSALDVKLHREVAATECPGILFPWEQIKPAMVGPVVKDKGGSTVEDWKSKIMIQAKEAGLIRDDHDPDDPAPKWFVLAVALQVLNISKLGGKSIE